MRWRRCWQHLSRWNQKKRPPSVSCSNWADCVLGQHAASVVRCLHRQQASPPPLLRHVHQRMKKQPHGPVQDTMNHSQLFGVQVRAGLLLVRLVPFIRDRVAAAVCVMVLYSYIYSFMLNIMEDETAFNAFGGRLRRHRAQRGLLTSDLNPGQDARADRTGQFKRILLTHSYTLWTSHSTPHTSLTFKQGLTSGRSASYLPHTHSC